LNVDEKQFYEALRGRRNILFLCHKNADADALGSAYALQRAFGGHIGVWDSPSAMAALLAERLKVNVLIAPDLSAYDLVVAVDTSTLIQTGYRSLGRCALIDHHTPGDLAETCEIALARIGSSTAELVYGLYKKNGLAIDADVAFPLVLAIITDTGHFRYAGAETIEIVGRILAEGGIRYADVVDFLGQVPVDLSSRIAVLKAASRITLHRVDDYLIVESRVSSFGSQAATALINLGADVAFVGSEKDRERRISGRVRRGIDLDLARLLQEVGKKFGGSGGGHAGAAGVVISGDVDKALEECIDMAVAKLLEHGKRAAEHDKHCHKK
jgi:nanoRNase/pAp phosphatase (c-di-AMP/oligoRNAs hydrolase)